MLYIGQEAKAVIESTETLWLRLYLGLEEAGVDVVLANPKKTKAIAEVRLKNDKVDARILVDLLREKLIAHCYVPPEQVRELRSLVRYRINLARDRRFQPVFKCKQACQLVRIGTKSSPE